MSGTPRIVIQRHTTPHPHYDLRLEMEGRLKSWILPTNFPVGDEKRLAIEDKDQELEFIISPESIISDGYGVGKVEVWDSGIYEVERKSRSRIVFSARCKKISGRFILLLPAWGMLSKKRLWVLFRD